MYRIASIVLHISLFDVSTFHVRTGTGLEVSRVSASLHSLVLVWFTAEKYSSNVVRSYVHSSSNRPQQGLMVMMHAVR